MAGRQLPFVSLLVPFWLVATFVRMEGGTWKEAWEVWPATLVSGASFALMQWFASASRAVPPDDRRGLRRVLGHLHGPVPALRLAAEDPFLLRSEREALAKPGMGGSRQRSTPQDWKYPVQRR